MVSGQSRSQPGRSPPGIHTEKVHPDLEGEKELGLIRTNGEHASNIPFGPVWKTATTVDFSLVP